MTAEPLAAGASHPAGGLVRPRAAVLAMAAVLGAFVLRPWLATVSADPSGLLVALFAVLLAVGTLWPLASGTKKPSRATALAASTGLALFAAGRVMSGGRAPGPLTGRVVVLTLLAAVAEEAFFRRFVFSALAPGGTAIAVCGSALLFAVAHVTVYGWWVLPIDFGAGLVLSWQRWVTGTWHVSALTHGAANLMVIL